MEFAEHAKHTALGLIWDVSTDKIIINVQVPDKPFTRRGVLSTVNSIFDPLGISAPIILDGKILLRQFLTSGDNNNSWDEPLPIEFEDSWKTWKDSLRGLSGLSISRCFRPENFGLVYSVHLFAFCDASIEVTSYVIYIRSTNEENIHQVSFVTGNSKIVPKSPITVPRLELCASVDVAIAAYNVAIKLNIPFTQVTLFSDSMITLGYLKNETRIFSRYITRRVNSVLNRFPSNQWRHVPTTENPADLASRRQSLETLRSSCWLSGPEFLQTYNFDDNFNEPADLPETIRNPTVMVTTVKEDFFHELFSRISQFTRIVNIFHFILKAIWRLCDSTKQRVGIHLATRPIPTHKDAEIFIVSRIHRHSFPELFKANISAHGKYSSLSPFIDGDVVRVGGRLINSNLDYENKFPMLLPNDHLFSLSMIRYHHEKVKHQGRSVTLSSLRENGIFINKASSTIRKIIRDCVICKKLRLSLNNQKMSDLPRDRLECAPPFTSCGMDVFGPFHVSEGKQTRRSTSTKKVWAVIFTCMSSRATHLEPLPFLDTSSMKNAIRRFICIRGPCRKFRSDRGTNFIGVKNQESFISLEELSNEFKTHNCE